MISRVRLPRTSRRRRSGKRRGAPAPFLSLSDDQRVCVRLQPSHEEAPVLIDQCEPTETVKSQIEQQQPASQPAPGAELAALVGPFIGMLELVDRLYRRVLNEMPLLARLIE